MEVTLTSAYKDYKSGDNVYMTLYEGQWCIGQNIAVPYSGTADLPDQINADQESDSAQVEDDEGDYPTVPNS